MSEFADLTAIFQAGLTRVDPYRMMVDHIRLEGDRLVVAFDGERHEAPLADVRRILVLGAGKASARMAKALEDILGDRIDQGLVSTKYGHGEPLARIEVVESGHPTPDANGQGAARRIVELARAADERTLILNLVSGGGSALLPLPLEGRLTLEDKQATTRVLLASGADIREINCIRKHISGVKGGQLLRLMAPARSLNFILSDVVGDRLDSIASGLTSPDSTTFSDALAIVDKYQLDGKAPAAVVEVLRDGAAGRLPETLKAGDPVVGLATNILIGTNQAAVLAARAQANALGYATVALTASLTGEAREVAKALFGIARDIKASGMLLRPPACVIAGGETTVTLKGSGKGGRNQELALAFLAELAREDDHGAGIHLLSASTDGSDGPTDAAGAFASATVLAEAEAAGLSLAAHLGDNNSYAYFDAIGRLLKTGPTMTNVCDLQIAIIR